MVWAEDEGRTPPGTLVPVYQSVRCYTSRYRDLPLKLPNQNTPLVAKLFLVLCKRSQITYRTVDGEEAVAFHDTELVFPSVVSYIRVLCYMFSGWAICQGRNVGGSVVRIAALGLWS